MNTETNRPLKWVPSAVLKSETHVDAEAAQHVINVTSFEMNVAGDFVVVIRFQIIHPAVLAVCSTTSPQFPWPAL